MSYCVSYDVKERALIDASDNEYDDAINSSIVEASRMVDMFIYHYIATPLTNPPSIVQYMTADFATSIFKRRYLPTEAKLRGTVNQDGLQEVDGEGYFALGMQKLQQYVRNYFDLSQPLHNITNQAEYDRLVFRGIITREEARRFMNEGIALVTNVQEILNRKKDEVESLVREETIVKNHSEHKNVFAIITSNPNYFQSGYVHLKERVAMLAKKARNAMYNPIPPLKSGLKVLYFNNGATGSVPVDNMIYTELDMVNVLPADLTKGRGFKLEGWGTSPYSLNAEVYIEGNKVNPPRIQMKGNNLELYAVFKPMNPLYVFYNGNGHTSGTVPLDSNNPYFQGETVTLLTQGNLVKLNHTFKGWTENQKTLSFLPNQQFIINNSRTFYALWEENIKYSIIYSGNGNTSGGAPIDSSFYYQNNVAKIRGQGNLAKKGHVFKGWGLDSNATSPIWYEESNVTMSMNLALYAIWEELPKYQVIYNLDSEVQGVVTDTKSPYHQGSQVQVIQGVIHKPHHSFIGWKMLSTGRIYRIGEVFTITADTHFDAVWKEDARFTVTYEKNFEGNLSSGTLPVDNDTYYYGTLVNTKNCTATRYGYVLLGYSVRAKDKTSKFAVGSTFIVTRNTVLYLIWKKLQVFKVSFHGMKYKDGTLPSAIEVPKGYSVTIPVTNITRPFHDFLGWSRVKGDLTADYVAGDIIENVQENFTLYAVWQEHAKVKLHYLGNGHSSGVNFFVEYYINTTQTVQGQRTLKKLYHHFLGWTTTPESDVEYPVGSSITLGDTTKLYAVWKEYDKYSLTYNGNGHTSGCEPVEGNSPFYEHNLVVVLTRGNLAKTGKKFMGWGLTSDGDVDFVRGDTIELTEDTVLYAIWVDREVCRVYYRSHNATGKVVDSTLYKIGDTATVMGQGNLEYHKEGYEWLGWNYKPNMKVALFKENDSLKINHDVTILYPVWKKIPVPQKGFVYYYHLDTEDSVYDSNNPYNFGDKATVLPMAREGYELLGYSYENNKTIVKVTVGQELTIKKEKLVLYPIWESVGNTFFVKFSKGTHGTFNDVTYSIKEGNPTPSAPTPTGKKGYKFTGWSPTLAPTVTEDVEYIAQWEMETYDIIYVMNGGTNNVNNPTSYDVETLTVIDKDPTDATRMFAGWTIEFTDGTPNITSPVETFTIEPDTIAETVTLTAHWFNPFMIETTVADYPNKEAFNNATLASTMTATVANANNQIHTRHDMLDLDIIGDCIIKQVSVYASTTQVAHKIGLRVYQVTNITSSSRGTLLYETPTQLIHPSGTVTSGFMEVTFDVDWKLVKGTGNGMFFLEVYGDAGNNTTIISLHRVEANDALHGMVLGLNTSNTIFNSALRKKLSGFLIKDVPLASVSFLTNDDMLTPTMNTAVATLKKYDYVAVPYLLRKESLLYRNRMQWGVEAASQHTTYNYNHATYRSSVNVTTRKTFTVNNEEYVNSTQRGYPDSLRNISGTMKYYKQLVNGTTCTFKFTPTERVCVDSINLATVRKMNTTKFPPSPCFHVSIFKGAEMLPFPVDVAYASTVHDLERIYYFNVAIDSLIFEEGAEYTIQVVAPTVADATNAVSLLLVGDKGNTDALRNLFTSDDYQQVIDGGVTYDTSIDFWTRCQSIKTYSHEASMQQMFGQLSEYSMTADMLTSGNVVAEEFMYYNPYSASAKYYMVDLLIRNHSTSPTSGNNISIDIMDMETLTVIATSNTLDINHSSMQTRTFTFPTSFALHNNKVYRVIVRPTTGTAYTVNTPIRPRLYNTNHTRRGILRVNTSTHAITNENTQSHLAFKLHGEVSYGHVIEQHMKEDGTLLESTIQHQIEVPYGAYNIPSKTFTNVTAPYLDVESDPSSGTVGAGEVLFVIWKYKEVQWTIGYNMNQGVNHPENPTGYGSSMLPIVLKTPTMRGYSFDCWFWIQGTPVILPNATIPVGTTGNLTCIAIWDNSPIIYGLHFNYNGGNTPPGQPNNYHVLTQVVIQNTHRPDATFLGYTVEFTDGTPPITTPTLNIVFTAGEHVGDIYFTAVFDNGQIGIKGFPNSTPTNPTIDTRVHLTVKPLPQGIFNAPTRAIGGIRFFTRNLNTSNVEGKKLRLKISNPVTGLVHIDSLYILKSYNLFDEDPYDGATEQVKVYHIPFSWDSPFDFTDDGLKIELEPLEGLTMYDFHTTSGYVLPVQYMNIEANPSPIQGSPDRPHTTGLGGVLMFKCSLGGGSRSPQAPFLGAQLIRDILDPTEQPFPNTQSMTRWYYDEDTAGIEFTYTGKTFEVPDEIYVKVQPVDIGNNKILNAMIIEKDQSEIVFMGASSLENVVDGELKFTSVLPTPDYENGKRYMLLLFIEKTSSEHNTMYGISFFHMDHITVVKGNMSNVVALDNDLSSMLIDRTFGVLLSKGEF